MTVKRWQIILFSLVTVGILIIVGLLSFVAGAVLAEHQGYLRRIDEEREWVEARLRGKPEFAKVEVGPRSNGGVDIGGEIATQKDLDRLRSEVVRAIGEHRTNESFHVEVK